MTGARRYALSAWLFFAGWRARRHNVLARVWTARMVRCREKLFAGNRPKSPCDDPQQGGRQS